MATSQRTFESRYGRFKNGNELIQAKSNYNPNNALIKKLDLTQFIETVALKDKSVNSTNTLYREKVGLRRINGFKGKKNLEDCLESRLQNVLSYVGAEIGRTSVAYKKIKSYLNKLAPKYDKKVPNLPSLPAKSKSEQSYYALISYGRNVANIAEGLEDAYNPANPNITVAALLALSNQMETWTKEIMSAEMAWSKVVAERKELYDGKDGMNDRIRMIKDYLASFAGGKKSDDYKGFCRLISGR